MAQAVPVAVLGGNEGGWGRQDLPGPWSWDERSHRHSVTHTDGTWQGQS